MNACQPFSKKSFRKVSGLYYKRKRIPGIRERETQDPNHTQILIRSMPYLKADPPGTLFLSALIPDPVSIERYMWQASHLLGSI